MEKVIELELTETDIKLTDKFRDFAKKNDIDIDEDCFSFEAKVYFDYHGACRGRRDKNGPQLEPDEPESIDINSIEYDEQCIYDFVNDVYKSVELEIIESDLIVNQDRENYEYEMERKADEMRDEALIKNKG